MNHLCPLFRNLKFPIELHTIFCIEEFQPGGCKAFIFRDEGQGQPVGHLVLTIFSLNIDSAIHYLTLLDGRQVDALFQGVALVLFIEKYMAMTFVHTYDEIAKDLMHGNMGTIPAGYS